MSVKEVKQAGASTAKLATLVGKAKQFIIDKTTWRPHIMDGSTPGGHPLAMKKDVDDLATEVATKQDAKELEDALKELITEYGGSVPQ